MVIKNKKLIKNSSVAKLNPEEKFWKEVDQQSHYLIADTLNKTLPLTNLRKKENFNPADDADYRTIISDYQNNYEDELPEADVLAEPIAYEYLLAVIKSLVGKLRDFSCHQDEYLHF